VQHLTSETLQYYAGGSLSTPDVGEAERHLAQCDACRKKLSLLVRVTALELSREEAAIVDSVEAALGQAGPFSPRPSALRAAPSWWAPLLDWRLAAVAVSLVIAAGLAWMVFSRSDSEPGLQIASSERPFEARVASRPYAAFMRTRAEARKNERPSSPQVELNAPNAGHEELGRLYLEQADFANAIRHFELAKTVDPASTSIRNDLGIAYMESAEESALTKAVGEFRQALSLDPRYEPALFNLAIAYERLGYLPEAQQQLKLYLQVDPQSPWAQEVKAKLQVWQR
jgi:Flp pilus assembly protein TadD